MTPSTRNFSFFRLFLPPLLVCLTLATAHAQELMEVKALRNDSWELHASLDKAAAAVDIRFQDAGTVKAQLATTCAREALPDGHFCLVVNQSHGTSHRHLPNLSRLRTAKDIVFRHSLQHFEIIADGQLLSRSFAPDSFKGRLLATALPDGTPCLKNVRYQRLEPIQFADDFMRTEEEAQQLGLWKPVSGNWKIYSVMERIQANPSARIRPGKIPVPDRSPNPFTLSGQSEESVPAFILAGQHYWNGYRVAVTAKPALGSAVGIVFSAKDPENLWYCKWTLRSYGTKAAEFQLIQRIGGKDFVRDKVFAKGRANNWTRLQIETAGRRIRAFIDGAPILEFISDTCTGGQIGLFTQGRGETHFDDVSVSSLQTMPLTLPEDLRECSCNPTLDGWKITQSTDFHAALHPVQNNTSLTFGGSAWPGQRAEVTFRPEKRLLSEPHFEKAGFRFGEDGALEASCEQKGGVIHVRLAHMPTKRVLQEIAIPVLASGTATRFALDTRTKGTISLWIDGKLALRHADNDIPVQGSVTLFATDTHLTCENITFFAEHHRDWEQPVDIVRFADDPYMQGWASPRYVWLRTRELNQFPQIYHFTGDIYGAFSLKTPIIDNLNYSFGADDLTSPDKYALTTSVDAASATASITLTRGGKQLFSAKLGGLVRETRPGTQIIDEKIGARPRTPDTLCWGDITFHRDGHAFWLEHKGKTIAYALEPQPLTGRALAADVPAAMDFIHISLLREHVKDYLFEKAEADFASQGRWEVTNRFACDPRWSFMNGESFGTAALTTKYDLKGDYTIECFAGMRMRQGELKENAMSYPRVGDINIAMQTQENDFFGGYNLIIQAWDPKWSETQTQFRRYGDIVATSTMELIPRGRHQSPRTRTFTQDWDPGGRPVHGAWYALKIRKTGSRYDVTFDNQKVFSYTDAKPLPDLGRIALWTQHNSIVLARVKINYRDLQIPAGTSEPETPLAARLKDSGPKDLAESPLTDFALRPSRLMKGIRPLNGDQSAEICGLTAKDDNSYLQTILLENCNPGGDFGITVPLEEDNELLSTTAIEFALATSRDARLNLYVIPENEALPHFFVPITGPAENGPDLYNLGNPMRTILASNSETGLDWVHVSIPLAALFRKAQPWYKGSMKARHLILGMLHEGYLNAGLGGNSNRAWAVLSGFNLYDITTAPKTNTLFGKPYMRLNIVSPAENDPWGLNPIEIAAEGVDFVAPVLAGATLTINGEKCPLTPVNTTWKDGVITISPMLTRHPDGVANFTFNCPFTDGIWRSKEWTARIDPKLDRTPPTPPSLDGCPEYITNVMAGKMPITDDAGETAYRLATTPAGELALEVSAKICGSRLPLAIPLNLKSIPQYPWVFFDMRIPEDTYIDLGASMLGATIRYNLTDREPRGAVAIYDAAGTCGDGQWHTLKADLFSALTALPQRKYASSAKLETLIFQNFGYSGTGPGASYAISNVRLARLGTTETLKIAWDSQDLNNVTHCAYAWTQKPDSEPDHAQTTTERTIIAQSLPQGLNYLHIKACDANGNWSRTTHQPFFIDNARPAIQEVVPALDSPAVPDELLATFTQDAFGLDFSNAKLTINDRPFQWRPSSADYNESNKKFSLPILRIAYPCFNRPVADKAAFDVRLSDIRNAAGTPVPTLAWKWQVDYAKDTQPPASPDITACQSRFSAWYRSFESEQQKTGNSNAPSLTAVDEDTKSKCRDVNLAASSTGGMVLGHRIEDVQALKTISFDIKLYPKTMASLLFNVAGTPRFYSLNAPGDERTFGRCQGIADNGKWQHVCIDFQKDILPALQKELGQKPLRRIAIGCYERNAPPQHFRIDNIVLAFDLPPVSPLTFSMVDATGISAVMARTTASMADKSLDDVSESVLTRRMPYFLVLNSTDTMILNSQIRDGAGNCSPLEQYPVFTSNPIKAIDNGNTLDDFGKYSWQLVPPTKKKRLNALYTPLESPDGKDKVLALYFPGGKQDGALLKTPVASLPGGKLCSSYTADFHLHSQTGQLTLSLVVLSATNDMLAVSPPVTLNPDAKWHRNQTFTLGDSARTATADSIAFMVYPSAKPRGILVIDNIR